MVLFAGIAAEALVYGEAEGGENDENLFRSISVLLQPPLSIAQVNDILRLIDFSPCEVPMNLNQQLLNLLYFSMN